MELSGFTLSDASYLGAELTLVAATIVLALLDLFMPKASSRNVIGWLSIAAVLVSAAFVVYGLSSGQHVQLMDQRYRIDDFASIMKLILLAGTGLVLLMSIGSTQRQGIVNESEYYYLFLPALLGGMVMVSSADLITLFVGLELLSITSYILVGISKSRRLSNEAAFKYVVLGAVSSAMVLYGMSFLYGISGSTNIGEIHSAIVSSAGEYEALLYVSFFLMLAGFGFKIAAAPFHAWAPDVYQGAPTPVSAFLAVVSKGAALALVFRLFYTLYYGINFPAGQPGSSQSDMFLAIAVLAAVTMVVGNVLALRQKNLKRLLAYSGIANSGYLLVPLAGPFTNVHYSNVSEFTYYLIAYTLMNIGAFAVLLVLENASGSSELKVFAGLYHRAPWTAIAMIVFILSLAGIPVTAGFFGKLFILLGAVETRLFWLAAVMIGTSVLSFYYYFSIVRQMFMRGGDADGSDIKVAGPAGVTIWLCAALTVALGFYPQAVLKPVGEMIQLMQDFFPSV